MKTLFLLRHADADGTASGSTDADRILSLRGRDEARTLPARIGEFPRAPTLALCSTARRAVQTLEGWTDGTPRPDLAVETDDSLYLASGNRLLERLLEVDDVVETVLIVAHNPGIGLLAHELLPARLRSPAADRVRRGFPPCALAVFEFDVERWNEVAPGRARLVDANHP